MPEVVDRDAGAEAAELAQHLGGALRVLHHHGLGDLEQERARCHAGLRRCVEDLLEDRVVLELAAREVDRHRERAVVGERALPDGELLAGLVEDPLADRVDQAIVLGDLDEAGR